MKVHEVEEGGGDCPVCGSHRAYNFRNSDDYLERETPRVREERSRLGLDGLAGGLQCAVINVEPDRLQPAAAELLAHTGFAVSDSFRDSRFRTVVLSVEGSADLLLRCRLEGDNPFSAVQGGPKSARLPNTRLETFCFRTPDLDAYMEIQRGRGVSFIDGEEVRAEGLRAAQTIPSSYTGLSVGLVQMDEGRSGYRPDDAEDLPLDLSKPELPFLGNIGRLDHTAARVRAEDRDAAIIEFMELTNYDFDFAIYVKVFNSITNVARISDRDFAMVFTSGITPDRGGDDVGPTQQFIRNYGTRVHHMALYTEEIQQTWDSLVEQGQEFMIDLVGSPEEGLRQTFSQPSPHTMLVTELIHRYGDFRGFFTRSNVTELTGATEGQ
jgi:4-hydroxyphenylpyruvate dioxygenase-like putative hemolysin